MMYYYLSYEDTRPEASTVDYDLVDDQIEKNTYGERRALWHIAKRLIKGSDIPDSVCDDHISDDIPNRRTVYVTLYDDDLSTLATVTVEVASHSTNVVGEPDPDGDYAHARVEWAEVVYEKSLTSA